MKKLYSERYALIYDVPESIFSFLETSTYDNAIIVIY